MILIKIYFFLSLKNNVLFHKPLTMLFFVVFLAIAFIIIASSYWKLHPLASLLLSAIFVGIMSGLPIEKIADIIGKGFGDLMTKIGLMVILGCIIGAILDKSGAAIRVADIILQIFGKKYPIFAMSCIGALVGIPVFCDSGFIILSKLNKIVAQKTKIPLASIAIALSGGLFATHTLVPPTPGPLSAAANFNLDAIGLLILVGIIVSIPSLFLSTWFAMNFTKHIETESDELTQDVESNYHDEKISGWKAFMPILLPIVLITNASFVKVFNLFNEDIRHIFTFLGSPLISFLLSITYSYFLFREKRGIKMFECFKNGIEHSGTTLVLVGAGGAFGAILKETTLKESISEWLITHPTSGISFLVMAFLVAAFFKTAQGSTTTSMVLTSAILFPLLESVGFTSNYELVLAVMAIGSGAMAVSHANDAWFWVVSRFSGISPRDAYRSHTLLTGLQGLISLLTTCLLWLLK